MRPGKLRFAAMALLTISALASTGCYEYLRFLFDAALIGALTVRPAQNNNQPAGNPALTSVPVVDVTTTTPEDTAKSVTFIPADNATAAFLATVTATMPGRMRAMASVRANSWKSTPVSPVRNPIGA